MQMPNRVIVRVKEKRMDSKVQTFVEFQLETLSVSFRLLTHNLMIVRWNFQPFILLSTNHKTADLSKFKVVTLPRL